MNLSEAAAGLTETGKRRRHRYCIVLSGAERWGLDCADRICAHFENQNVILVGRSGDSSPAGPCRRTIGFQECRHRLGSETDAVIYNGHSGFEPDSLGAIAGTVTAGGFLVLLTPHLDGWADRTDPFFSERIPHGCKPAETSPYLKRIARRIAQSEYCILIKENEKCPRLPENPAAPTPSPIDFSDQQNAIRSIKKVVTGQRRRPAVLLADRGRGKSAALGIAAGELLDAGLNTIAVCALNRQSAQNVFKHAGSRQSLKYMPADVLLTQKMEIDLLLVDEAAALSIAVLTRLLKQYPRIAFASTVHGYEGTGRGFVTHFGRILDKHTRGWNKVALNHPIRWNENDPLEKFLFDLLLLNAESGSPGDGSGCEHGLEIQPQDRQRLSGSESKLRQTFALLVNAHYRTRPADLRYLLDSPNLRIYSAVRGDALQGVAVVSIEGGLTDEEAKQIWANRSRPAGHLFPGLAAAQLGFAEGARLSTARVVRIAVKPELRRRGIGSSLLAFISRQHADLDYLSTSFSAAADLMRFWRHNGFRPIRVGLSQNKNTGSRACALMRPISNDGRRLFQRAHRRLKKNFPIHLRTQYDDADPTLVLEIYAAFEKTKETGTFSDEELTELVGFGFAGRNPEDIAHALFRFAEFLLIGRKAIAAGDAVLLIERVLQGKPWHRCRALEPPRGQKQGRERLKKIVAAGLTENFAEKTGEIRQRLHVSGNADL